MSGCKIKICSLRRQEDISYVNRALPDFAGFIINFPKSHRSTSADEVRALREGLDERIQPVGVFVDEDPRIVAGLLKEGTIGLAQLHGSETPEMIRWLQKETSRPVNKAFIPFITCGDPSLEVTRQLVFAMAEAGADIIELGIPFSDPTAEGPVIQGANLRALSGGVTTDKIFTMVKEIRKTCQIPLVFMTYANVVFSYGTELFMKRSAEVGMDGLILPDVPFEEKEEFDAAAKNEGLDLISLIAPTSHERITKIAREAEGFVYCVSSLGVTGTRSQITTDIASMVRLVKEVKDIPCAVGFGISTPEQANKMASQSDGAIVGSAIVKLCAKYGPDCVPYVQEYVRQMKKAVIEDSTK